VSAMDEMRAPQKAALSRVPRPTAVFAALDPTALKAYSVAAELGFRVPQDVSVVGYADFPFATDLTPPLTTIKQDPYQMGRQAARVLLDRILDRSASPAPHRYHFAPELVVRQSTGPAPED
jgi:LacI family transcriptional regulator